MTQDEYNAALTSGAMKVEEPAPSESSAPTSSSGESSPSAQAAPPAEVQTSIDQFLPVLVALQSTQKYLSAAPTFVPQTFQDQIQFVYAGGNLSLYVYFKNQWNQIPIGQPPWSTVNGTDTDTETSHSHSTTHTITHALGRTPKIIMATAQLNPNGVPGANTNLGVGVGTIMLDGSGNIIGGFAVAFETGSPAGALTYISLTALSGSITASTTTSGGTANMTITVNNVTSTTFDIVYTVSDNGGAGAPTQNFTAQWTVMG